MGKIITFNEKNVKERGKSKEDEIDKEKWKSYFFEDDLNNLKLIGEIDPFSMKGEINWFYPGCGVDILYPLVYLEKLFPKVKKANFIFVDVEDNLNLIKTILDNVGVSFSKIKNGISFYWKKKEINLYFYKENVSKILEKDFKYNVYFEKAFRITKERINNYEKRVFEKLVRNGVVISDNGFGGFDLKRRKASKELSSYKEMVVGIKD